MQHQPQPLKQLQARFGAALRRVWDAEKVSAAVAANCHNADRPGIHPDHVFDGVGLYGPFRLIVSIEEHSTLHGAGPPARVRVLHVSCSFERVCCRPHLMSRAIEMLCDVSGSREWLCMQPTLSMVTLGRVAHLFFEIPPQWQAAAAATQEVHDAEPSA